MNFFDIETWDELIKRITCDLECAGCPFKEDCYKGLSNCDNRADEHLMYLLKTRDGKPTAEESEEDWKRARALNS